MKLTCKILTITFALLSFTVSAYAQEEQLGASSYGDSDISVTTTEMIQITNVGDITVNPYVPSSGIDLNDNVCIYSNDTNVTPEYLVTATGSGASSAFTITNGSDTIAYTVRWNNAASAGTTALVTTVQSAAFDNASNTYPCPANNANFRVAMTNNNILSVPAGTYTGTLTLTVVPNPA